MMKGRYFFLLPLFFIQTLSGRSQSCENEIKYCADLIKKNYAGFFDKTDTIRFNNYVKSVLKNSGVSDCFYKLSLLAIYFKDEHLIVQDTSKVWLDASYKNTKFNLDKVRSEIARLNRKGKYTDYWVSSDNKVIVGIIRDSDSPDNYSAYIIENKRGKLPPGHVKFFIKKLNGQLYSVFVSENGSRTLTSVKFYSRNIIQIGAFLKLQRIKKYTQGLLDNEKVFTPKATFEETGDGVSLIKVPAGSFENVQIVDSLLTANKERIESNRYLIIDVRNNGGGTILPLMKLLKYLNTGPISDIESKVLCSDGVIEKSKELVRSSIGPGMDSGTLKYLHAEIDSFEAHRNGWYNVKPSITLFDSVCKYPEKVAVIMNFACRSATELMLLKFRQSSKVKLFGENTFGAVDYLEFLPYNTPINNYILRIARTKRIIPDGGAKFDNYGITPDVRINLPEVSWVDFVKKYLLKKL